MTPGTVVLDASVGAKWFLDERGSRSARELLRDHGLGRLSIAVPSLFVYEVMSAATRGYVRDLGHDVWRWLAEWRIGMWELNGPLMCEALEVRARLGCSLYDAFSPALAGMLDAPLYSADRRAHAAWPGVVLIDDEGDDL